ncbi:MAG: DUF2339 domain-containing protein [Phycisphaerae bacterium]|nr:DUF2339 domain-containing protein [Phycisphaerae bacterium]
MRHSSLRHAPSDEPGSGEGAASGDRGRLETRLDRLEARLEALTDALERRGLLDRAAPPSTDRREQSTDSSRILGPRPDPVPPPPPVPAAAAIVPPSAPIVPVAPVSAPAVPRASVTPVASRVEEARSVERFLGAKLAAWIGALTLLGALGVFATYAYREGWLGRLGPGVRYALANAAAIALVVAGEIVRRRLGRGAAAGFSAAGVAGLFLATWAGAGPLGVLPPAAAMGVNLAVVILGVIATARSGLASVGAVALLGGYGIPLLLGGEPRPLLLAGYLTVLLLCGLGLSAWSESFRLLRPLLLPLHGPWAVVWMGIALERGQSTLAITIGALWWTAFAGESWLAATRGQSASSNAAVLLAATSGYALLGAVPLARVGAGVADPLAWVPVGLGAAIAAWAATFSSWRPWRPCRPSDDSGGDGESPTDRADRAIELFSIAAWGAAAGLIALGLGALISSRSGLALAWSAVAVGAVETSRRSGRVGVAWYGWLVGLLAFAVALTLLGPRTGAAGLGIPGTGGWVLRWSTEPVMAILVAVAAMTVALRWPGDFRGLSWSRVLLVMPSSAAARRVEEPPALASTARASGVGDLLAVSVAILGAAILWSSASARLGGGWATVALVLLGYAAVPALGPAVRRVGGSAIGILLLAAPILAWIVMTIQSERSMVFATPAADAWSWSGLRQGDGLLVAFAIAAVGWLGATRLPRTSLGRAAMILVPAVLVAVAATVEVASGGGARLSTAIEVSLIALSWGAMGLAAAWRGWWWKDGELIAIGSLLAILAAGYWVVAIGLDALSWTPLGWSIAVVPVAAVLLIAGLVVAVRLLRGLDSHGEDPLETHRVGSRRNRPMLAAAAWVLVGLVVLAAVNREIAALVDGLWSWRAPESGVDPAAYRSVRGSAASLWWGIFGTGLVVLGFRPRFAPSRTGRVMRLSGLALLGITAVKFATIDLRTAGTVAKIVAMLVVGLLLVGTSVLYARWSGPGGEPSRS